MMLNLYRYLAGQVPSKYSLVILEAKRAHELEAGAPAIVQFCSKSSPSCFEEIESGKLFNGSRRKTWSSSSPVSKEENAAKKKKKRKSKSKLLKKKEDGEN